jgi:hypothetical protein
MSNFLKSFSNKHSVDKWALNFSKPAGMVGGTLGGEKVKSPKIEKKTQT